MPPLNLLIKPASGNCNLQCRYCFYRDESRNRAQGNCGMMSDETMGLIVKKAIDAAERFCTFGFQGGEPMVSGLPFFERTISLQKEYAPPGLAVENLLQTNGTLMDDKWAAFFAENHFLIGLSLDGPARLHDQNRRTLNGRGSFDQVMRAAHLLKKYDVPFNTLTVVTAQTARNIRSVYPFFVEHGFTYQQYIPCLDPIGEARGKERYSLTPELYGDFLKALFDLWYASCEKGEFVYIRYFDNLIRLLQGRRPETCAMAGVCAPQYAFEADGSVYPCDFYMTDPYCLGNIRDSGFADIHVRRMEMGFTRPDRVIPEKCRKCEYGAVCRRGCRRDRGDDGINYFCEAYRDFFAYALPRLLDMARTP